MSAYGPATTPLDYDRLRWILYVLAVEGDNIQSLSWQQDAIDDVIALKVVLKTGVFFASPMMASGLRALEAGVPVDDLFA